MDPLWNSLVVAGLQPVPNGPAKPFIGFIGMLGTHYDDEHVATGLLHSVCLLSCICRYTQLYSVLHCGTLSYTAVHCQQCSCTVVCSTVYGALLSLKELSYLLYDVLH